jgi:DNA modification methylase
MKADFSCQTLLERVNWDFEDYSSRVFKLDINSIHWYPASFIPQIPDILIQNLSEEGDIILDPFAGSGVTLVEATKLGRRFIGTDINPFAVEIARAKFQAISHATAKWRDDIFREISRSNIEKRIEDYCAQYEINPEVFNWFERASLIELACIHKVILGNRRNCFQLERVIFSSILNRTCSQKRHYTYITDGCYPEKLEYKPAKKLFLEQVDLAKQSSELFNEQYLRRHSRKYSCAGTIESVDARHLDFVESGSVDAVVTSPPYLGSHDYMKSMRLTNLFFPNPYFKKFIENEIGARCKRHKKAAYEEYLEDMKSAFGEINRVLRPGGFIGMTLGRGIGKVIKGDIVQQMLDFLINNLRYTMLYRNTRKISSRRIRFPGVPFEHIIVMQKAKQK